MDAQYKLGPSGDIGPARSGLSRWMGLQSANVKINAFFKEKEIYCLLLEKERDINQKRALFIFLNTEEITVSLFV